MEKTTLTTEVPARSVLTLRSGRELRLSQPLVMGILNVTPDSFSDGGRHIALPDAIEYAQQMETDGVDIIDVGGESTRPGAEPVDAEEEMTRVIPVISSLKSKSSVLVSIDTYKAKVAQAALEVGADIINDISALRFDSNMVDLVAKTGVPLALVHMLGTPRSMQDNPSYQDCVGEISRFFSERIQFCQENGIDRSKLILDPGIGFGKRLQDSIAILSGLHRFTELGLPLLVGASRKSFIGKLHNTGRSADSRIGGSVAAAVTAVQQGASIVRVHDVAETVEALKVAQAIREGV